MKTERGGTMITDECLKEPPKLHDPVTNGYRVDDVGPITANVQPQCI